MSLHRTCGGLGLFLLLEKGGRALQLDSRRSAPPRTDQHAPLLDGYFCHRCSHSRSSFFKNKNTHKVPGHFRAHRMIFTLTSSASAPLPGCKWSNTIDSSTQVRVHIRRYREHTVARYPSVLLIIIYRARWRGSKVLLSYASSNFQLSETIPPS